MAINHLGDGIKELKQLTKLIVNFEYFTIASLFYFPSQNQIKNIDTLGEGMKELIDLNHLELTFQ